MRPKLRGVGVGLKVIGTSLFVFRFVLIGIEMLLEFECFTKQVRP